MTISELFDVSGRSALIAGASGAFGAVAARTLAEAGCKLTLASGNADALEAVADECRERGAAAATSRLPLIAARTPAPRAHPGRRS